MLALVSAGEAKTANGAVERMVLLGLTPRIIAYFVARFRLAAKNAKADDLRSGDIRRLRCGRNQTATEVILHAHAQRQAYTVKHIQKGPTLFIYSAKCHILIRSNVIMLFGRISNIDQSSTRFGSPRACFGSSTRPEIVRRLRWCSRR